LFDALVAKLRRAKMTYAEAANHCRSRRNIKTVSSIMPISLFDQAEGSSLRIRSYQSVHLLWAFARATAAAKQPTSSSHNNI
jgi:hypothetical protein